MVCRRCNGGVKIADSFSVARVPAATDSVGPSRELARTMRERILVVAQDVTLRSTLARWLMPAGYSVELAGNDRRAREVLASEQISLTIASTEASHPVP